MGKRSAPVLIGDLLVKSELVSLGQFADAMPISLKTGLPVGRVLVGSGNLKEAEFKSAVQAQSLVRENLLPMDMALNALRLVRLKRASLDDALKELGWRSEYYEATNRLGELLVAAECLTQPNLDEALDACFTSGLPLGRVLVLRQLVSEMLAYAALTAQVLIREGHITREQAVDGLKQVSKRNVTIEESLDQRGVLDARRGHTIRLGELLMLADLVSEIDLLSAVERGLVDEMPIGQVLVRVGLITEATLDQALRLQEQVSANNMKPLDAADILRKVRKSGVSLEKAMSEFKSGLDGKRQIMEMPELLRTVGCIAQTDMIKAIDYSSASGMPFEQVLMTHKLVDNTTMEAANRCHSLLLTGQISPEQCVFALQTWLGSRKSIDDALSKVGWQPPTRAQ